MRPKPTTGQLANLLTDFGQPLAAFYADLGDRMAEVCVVTMSEFGRTARENGSRGTDHGHANVMFVLGGGIKEQRDLDVTTDFAMCLANWLPGILEMPKSQAYFQDSTSPASGLGESILKQATPSQ